MIRSLILKMMKTPALQKQMSSRPIYFIDPVTNEKGSFIHDVPLKKTDTTYNMVVEIPRNKNAKMEASLDKEFNPIVQDEKPSPLNPSEKQKRYLQYFPLGNYGFIPQTWEDPAESIEGHKGDGDPVDILDLSPNTWKAGDIKEVQVLGALGLIDEGELDWKVMAMEKEYYDSVSDLPY